MFLSEKHVPALVINNKALDTFTWKCNNKKNIIVTLETNCRNARLGKEPVNFECNNNNWVYDYGLK